MIADCLCMKQCESIYKLEQQLKCVPIEYISLSRIYKRNNNSNFPHKTSLVLQSKQPRISIIKMEVN